MLSIRIYRAIKKYSTTNSQYQTGCRSIFDCSRSNKPSYYSTTGTLFSFSNSLAEDVISKLVKIIIRNRKLTRLCA